MASTPEYLEYVLDLLDEAAGKNLSPCGRLDLDTEGLLKASRGKKLIVTVEEHAPYGGLGSRVAQEIAAHDPRRVITLALPDAPVITGASKEVFDYYGLNAAGIANTVRKALEG